MIKREAADTVPLFMWLQSTAHHTGLLPDMQAINFLLNFITEIRTVLGSRF